MRRYFKFLTTSLIACVLTIACVNELDLHQPINESEFYTTLVPRVEGFANQYITKSSYETSEQKITKLAILVFNEVGTCIHLQESENGGPITLNKSMLNSPEQSGKLDQATVVMIANIGTDKIVNGEKTIKDNWSSLTFSDLENYSFQYDDAQTIITSLGDGFIGFPMIGASKVDLTSTKQQQQADIEVKLKILYAKIKFAISVAEGTENQETGQGTGISFTLTNYSVFNASKQTKLAVPTNQGEPTMSFEEFLLGQKASESPQPAAKSSATESDSYAYNDPDNPEKQGSFSVDGNSISFTFYVSESRFNHGLSIEQLADADIYPDAWRTKIAAEDVKDYTEDDKNKLNGVKYFYDELAQQYKPLLAQSESGEPAQGLATYVLLNGKYKDYRGEIWNVNYKVYLGKDNSQNFQVDRNSCYTNNIVIKGIRNNDDTDAHGEVWIDHRVDVEIGGDGNSAADHITITRETLIDSHIEVRPLRVQWPEGEYAGVRVYLPTNSNGTLVNWIGMERFTGDNCQESTTYCYDKNRKSTGKRRYFTTSLISELQSKEGEYGVQEEEDGSKKYIILLNGECAWIYFDEYVESSARPREAEILLEFYPTDETKPVETIRYKVKQKGLLMSKGGYFYESYEEYLHSYDSYDTYNISTSPIDYTQQGLKWGYEGIPLSTDIIVSMNDINLSQAAISERYDFLVKGDSYDSWHMYHRGGGLLWDEITNYDNQSGKFFTDMVTEKKKVSIMDMGTMPESAYQYCLSKNKFTVDADENVSMEVHWYLPDVSEMQDILSSGSNSLYSDVYYWSSQPSFSEEKGTLSTYLNENKGSARAVSNLVEEPVDLPREHQHRIRCLYSPVGIKADMDERTPDGIGGNHSFVMKAYLDKNRSGNGYFNYLIDNLSPEVKTTTEHPYKFDDNSYDYPKKSNSYPTKPEYGFKYEVTKDKDNNNFEGFEVDPDKKTNWQSNSTVNIILSQIDYDYYYTLAKYKGLSADSVRTLGQDASILGSFMNSIINSIPGIDLNSLAREVKNTPKSDTLIEVEASTLQYDRDLHIQPDLNLLLPYEDGGLSIRFSQQDGNEHPIYSFLEYQGGTRTTSVRNWIAPIYDSVTRPMKAMSQTVEHGGSGQDDASSYRSNDRARREAFEGTLTNLYNGAHQKAKDNALAKLETLLESDDYQGWNRGGSVTYTPLTYESTDEYVEVDGKKVQAVNYINEKITGSGSLFNPYQYHVTCVVNLIATIQLTKPGSKTLYVQAVGTGKWGEGKPDGGVPVPSVVETDQLKVFGGNSFTVKVSNPDYEITKVKVYYSESNLITEFATGDKAYVRFIDSSNYNQLPIDTDPSGMDYQDEEIGGIHQWSGPGRSEVTLVLVDYLDMTDYGNWFQKTYRYEKASKSLSKYLIIDKIEVKCTKKPEAGN